MTFCTGTTNKVAFIRSTNEFPFGLKFFSQCGQKVLAYFVDHVLESLNWFYCVAVGQRLVDKLLIAIATHNTVKRVCNDVTASTRHKEVSNLNLV